MRIGRTLPPAATPIAFGDVMAGVRGIFRGRKELDRFQSELREYFGVKHCFLVSSGKAAFTLILLALKELFPHRDQVLIPAFTCYSVPSSVVRAGLRIRLCDLHPDSFDFDYAQLLTLLSESSGPRQSDPRPTGSGAESQGDASRPSGGSGTSVDRLLAVVPVHLFGFPANVSRLREWVRDPEVTIVEDAAQAMGEMSEGQKLGTLGDVGFFSLGRGKALSTIEGGVILTDRDDIAEVLHALVAGLPGYEFRRLMTLVSKAAGVMIFSHPLLFWIPRSMPFLRLGETFFEPHFPMLRMSPFQAGLAVNWRQRLPDLRETRKANARRWLGVMAEAGNGRVRFQHAQSLGLLRFPIRIHDRGIRESLLRESASRGTGVMPVYPQSINRLPELKGEVPGRSFPVAESCARELVTLPTHSYLTSRDVTMIRRLLSQALTMTDSRLS